MVSRLGMSYWSYFVRSCAALRLIHARHDRQRAPIVPGGRRSTSFLKQIFLSSSCRQCVCFTPILRGTRAGAVKRMGNEFSRKPNTHATPPTDHHMHKSIILFNINNLAQNIVPSNSIFPDRE